MFFDKLNEYIVIVGCTGRELAELSGISAPTISRYRSGERTPKPGSEDLRRLCRGICAADSAHRLSYAEVYDALGSLAAESDGSAAMQPRLNLLFSVLSINAAEMSKALKYDSSYISRIRSGQRRPARPEQFARDAAEYIARCYDSDSGKKIVAELIGAAAVPTSRAAYAAAIRDWLTDGAPHDGHAESVSGFLQKLNDFDLGEYIRAIRFDDLKVPTLPFQLPTSKSYYGVEEMKAGELDFLKATALSRSKQEVFMCSDMQMDDMAKDAEFSKKYMFGLAAMLKKGLHLNVVHNLNRPFNELMLGLECWIPLYMTGQISPYYLRGVHNRIFCHFLNVSGAAALSGESISGCHAHGKYYLTKNRDELAYYKKRATDILKKAHPLMEIYREENSGTLNAFLLADAHSAGVRRNILPAPPLYTMTDGLLPEMLKSRSVSEADSEKIRSFAQSQKNLMEEILKTNTVTDLIPQPTEEDFAAFPPTLFAPGIEAELAYTYAEYTAHLQATRDFAARQPNYFAEPFTENAFRNIRIVIHEGEWVMISKNKSPAIHFIIRHPTLRDAIERIEFPY